MSHGYSTTIRMGAAHFDITFGGERVDLVALLYGKPHGDQHRILREASAAVCKLHGIGAKRVEKLLKHSRPKRTGAVATSQPRTRHTPRHVPTITVEATL